MAKKRSQCDRILEYIQKFGTINLLQAFADCACSRLAARVWDLRHQRHIPIETRMVTGKNRWGETIRYAEYSVPEEWRKENWGCSTPSLSAED